MRAFIALDLPEPLHAALAEAQRSFRSAAPDARWSRPEGIHLTLKFLGEISDAQTKQVVESLTNLGPFEPFPVAVKGFGFFPQARKARVFWAGITAPPRWQSSPRAWKPPWKRLGSRARIAFSHRTSRWHGSRFHAPSQRWKPPSRQAPQLHWVNLMLQNSSCLKVNYHRKDQGIER